MVSLVKLSFSLEMSSLVVWISFFSTVSGGVLCEFLEVAFHLILYVREVYPPVVFERRKKYNVPVQVHVHLSLLSF